MREHCEVRKSAGSRSEAAKLWKRWRASLAAKAGKEALVDGRRSGSGKPFSLTRGRWKRFWCSARARRRARVGRDKERQRPDCQPRAVADNAAARKRRKSGARLLLIMRRDAGEPSEAGEAPSSAALPGAGLLQGGPTPRSRWHEAHALCSSRRRSSRRKLRARESCDSRVLESLMSVAEVGEKHLPGVVEVSREASQEGAG